MRHEIMQRRRALLGIGAWGLGHVGSHIWIQGASARDKLEKQDLKIGFIPMTDCAPIVIAAVKGYFKNNGLNVQLSKEASWATVREGLIEGRLDASQTVAGMPLSVQLGVEGSKRAPMVTAVTLNRNGNSVTLSKQLAQAGVTDGTSLKRLISSGKVGKTLSGAMVIASSMYNYNLRFWLAHHGIDPDRDTRIVALPPAQLLSNLKAGNIDFFCVTEPWNSRAVAEQIGFTAVVDRDIWRGHPEKVLAVMEPWAEANPNTHRALVRAVIQACRWCDAPENQLALAEILASEAYLNTDPSYIRPALSGNYNYGGFDASGKARTEVRSVNDFFVFYRTAAPYLRSDEQATFPWRSQGMWILTQMVRWGQLQALPKDADQLLRRVYRTDIYRDVAAEMGFKAPQEDDKIETGFIDGRRFDPSDPATYLKNFEIKTRS
jgi:nitrate/nitrite transport system substrate-binding protein